MVPAKSRCYAHYSTAPSRLDVPPAAASSQRARHGCVLSSGGVANHNNFARFDAIKSCGASWKKLLQMVEPVGGRLQDDDRYLAPRQVLLVAEVGIDGNKHIENSFRATVKSSPFCFPDQPASCTVRHSCPCFVRKVFRAFGVHSSSSTFMRAEPSLKLGDQALPSFLSAATASSRLTLGYCSKNWSRVSPLSR